MNTSLPLLNVASGSQATGARTANQADSFSAEAPFKQVLNSQVNSRNSESRPQDQPKAPEKEAAQPAAPAAQQQGAASSTTKKADADSAKKDDDHDQDDDTDTAASAQLLALVANLEQNAVKPVSDEKGESTEADLLAQAKRGGPKLSLQGEDQPVAEGRGKKTDFAALQDSVAANGSKKEATPDLAQQNQLDAARAAKPGDKSPAELGADAKTAAPTDDLAALAARAQGAKTATEAINLRQEAAPVAATPVVLPAMQQTLAATQSQAAFGAHIDKILPNVGSAGWDQAVGQKVTWMVSGGIQNATLTLNPPDLGPLQVVLSVNNSHADATFTTAQPEVKQALEQAMPRLREMMEQAGIQLGQATVNTGTPNQNQGQGQQANRSSSGRSFGDDGEGEVVAVTTPITASGGLGLVDTFA
ncbi:flagellar hook-length control protein FliK [Herbaspirillum sp. alder98]|uniref:flagellar hook-length control protein FliK n=1 Tax=Herbaspirillum sp. alder98 TaxID=2913096 RepID=UPI001CD83CDF|nr:flagellar hook-length control protein FliK [Herbaspirillum sp. alder98]MCA1322593.1 flagellar hook-length control protein FliK [Herbaspirillum sp. alder98]